MVNLLKIFSYDVVSSPSFTFDTFDYDDIHIEYNQKVREQRLNSVLGVSDDELDEWIKSKIEIPYSKELWFPS